MSDINIFEFVTRNKVRFPSSKGLLTIEQLWDVPLRSTDDFNLDKIAKDANKEFKGATEESFVQTARTPAIARLELTLEAIKHVIATKLADEKAAKERAENKVKREKLLKALSEKQDGKLSEMSEKELKKQIAELEAEG